MSVITRTYTFSDGTDAYGSQVESEFQNVTTVLNGLDAGTSSWANVKTALLLAGDGTIGAPGMAFSGETGLGFRRSGTHEVDIVTNGSTVAAFYDAGVILYASGNQKVSVISTAFQPTTDNSISCGATGQRFTALWAVNGAIQTSISETKRDIQGVPDEKFHIPPARLFKREGDALLQLGFIADDLPDECFAIKEDGTRSDQDVYLGGVVGQLCLGYSKLEARILALEMK